MASSLVEGRMHKVRVRLEQLGYRQPLGLESLPLVTALLSDLIHTTESLKKIKSEMGQRIDKQAGAGGDWVSLVEPLKGDNAKLTREVNQLHMELIRRKDAADAKAKEAKAILRKVEQENADLRFLNTQYAHKIRVMESDHASLMERLSRLTDAQPSGMASSHVSGGRVVVQQESGHGVVPVNRARMEIKHLVEPADTRRPAHSVPQESINLLHAADETIQTLEMRVKELEQDKLTVDTRIAAFQAQVERRDREIERLGRLMENGRPTELISADSRKVSSERHIAQLEHQVDFLQQTNKALQDELLAATHHSEEVSLQFADMQAKNAKLGKELDNLDRLARELQNEKLTTEAEATRELRKEKTRVEREKQALQEKLKHVSTLQNENKRLVAENQHMTRTLTVAEREVKNLQQDVEKLTDDNKYLHQKVRKLQESESALQDQLRQVRLDGDTQHAVQKPETAAEEALTDDDDTPRLLKRRIGTLEHEVASITAANDTLQRLVTTLEDERDRYKRELKRLEQQLDGNLFPHTREDDDAFEVRGISEARAEIKELRFEAKKHKEEAETLRQALRRVELRVADVASELSVAREEKDNILALYSQCAQELARARQPQSARSDRDARERDAVMRAEAERDEYVQRWQDACKVRDRLQSEVATLQAEAGTQQTRLGQRADAARTAQLQAERDTLAGTVAALRVTIDGLEEKATRLEGQLNEKELEVVRTQEQVQQLRLLLDQVDRSQEERNAHHHRQAHRIQSLEAALRQAEERAKANEAEAERLRQGLHEVDADRDMLQNELDEKTELISTLRMSQQGREAEQSTLASSLAEAATRIQGLQRALAERDRDIQTMRRQGEAVAASKEQLAKEAKELKEELERARIDLNIMTQENQSLHGEINTALHTRSELEDALQQLSAHAEEVEGEVRKLLEEREAIVAQYKQLNTERAGLETRVIHAQGSESERLLEIRAYQDRIEELEAALLEAGQQQGSAEVDLLALEEHTSQLSQALGKMEEQFRMVQNERESLAFDLAAARQLSMTLGKSRDEFSERLATMAAENERLRGEVLDSRARLSADAVASASEEQHSRELQVLLATERTKAMQAEMRVPELQAEIMAEKDRRQAAEKENQTLRGQVGQLRDANMQLDGQVKKLRRDLTNVRYKLESSTPLHNVDPQFRDSLSSLSHDISSEDNGRLRDSDS